MTTSQTVTIAFIGAGNMGRALIEGCLQSGISPDHLIVVDPDVARQQDLTDRGIRIFDQPVHDLMQADIILFCVKPNQMKATISEVNPFLTSPIIVSIAAGVLIDTIQSGLVRELMVVRAMPNTPATIGQGMTALCCNQVMDDSMKTTLSGLFDSIGQTLWLSDESEMDIVTALSGSGPAYFFYVMSAMIDAAKAQGFSEEAARKLVRQTALGAAHLALVSDAGCEELRKRVTSKGGTTEAAITVFEDRQMDRIIKEAIDAASFRSRQMSQEYK